MYFNQYKFKYLEWHSAEEIHEITLRWQSQLDFIKDEQQFLTQLLKEYTLALLSDKDFSSIRSQVELLSGLQQQLPTLRKKIIKHRNDLEVLVDGINEIKRERAFQDRHLLLELKIEHYLKEYKVIKKQLFDVVRQAIKSQRKKRLLT
ncbi:hypothetical protein [Croceiramulus getboli]|nr:hypothetical protein P8624_09585 [Flavobacteriaceae bacterium YJPT1-3]